MSQPQDDFRAEEFPNILYWKIMQLYEVFTILIVLLCCFYASYTDIKFRKVRNFCTFSLISLGLFNQILLVLLDKSTITDATFLVIGGFLGAYLMYLTGIWAPGDSKLFLGAALALPKTVFEHFVGMGEFPILGLLINIFLPYFLIAMFSLSYKVVKGDLKINLQVKEVLKDIATLIYNLLCFMGLVHLLLYPVRRFDLQLNYFLLILFFFGFFALFRKFVVRYHLGVYQMIILLPFLFVTIFLISPPLKVLINMTTVSVIMYLLIKILAGDLGQAYFIEERDIYELKPGVVLAEKIVKVEDERYEKRTGTFSAHFTKGVVVGPTPEGLSEQTIKKLKQLCEEGYFRAFGNKVKVQHSMCFAPFIALGILLTVLSKGAIYRYLLF